MKKLIVIVFSFMPWAGLAQSGGAFVLKVKDEAAPASTTAHMQYRVDGKMIRDSSRMADGVFTFSGTVPYPVKATLWANNDAFGYENGHKPDHLVFYLEKDTIYISTKDSVKNAVITGSKINDENQQLQAFTAAQLNALSDLNFEGVMAVKEKRFTPEFASSYRARYKKAVAAYRDKLLQYVKLHPGSYVSVDALSQWAGPAMKDVATVASLYGSLSPGVRQTRAGREFLKRINVARSTTIGAIAPDFVANDTAGKAVRLSGFRGKYVLLDFWASWCGPCRAENPNYVKAYQEYKDKGFTILSVSLDKPDAKKAWLAAIKADGLTWTQVSDLKYWDSDIARKYGIRSIPRNFLIDPAGKIIATDLRGDKLEAELSKVLE